MTQHTSRSTHRHTRYTRALRHLEPLEPRTLLSATITSYTLEGAAVGYGAYDSSGALWVYDVFTSELQRVNAGAVDTAPGSIIPLSFSPGALATGPDGHIFAADWSGSAGYGAIVDIDTLTGDVNATDLTASGENPIALTVTGDGAVWFVGAGTQPTEGPITQTNIIGRLDPLDSSVATFTTDASLDDSQASVISANGNSVWIAMGGLQVGGEPTGTNRVAAASWDGSTIALTAYDVAVPGSDAGANGLLNGLVADGAGGVWFTLSNNPTDTGHTTHSADQLVHGIVVGDALDQTAYIDAATSVNTPLNYGALSLDTDGNVWFVEFAGTQFGMLDASTGAYTLVDNPTPDAFYQSVANTNGTQISLLNTPNFVTGTTIIQIEFAAAPVTFSGTANNVNIREDTPLDNILLATFTAPTPLSGYTATITWGDNTTSVVTPTLVPGSTDTYAIIISGKSFATQGIFNGSIAITDGTASVGTLTFTSTISDTPLNVTSLTASPLFLRIVTAVGTFTDDGDLALSTWKATINWGDNSTSTGLIVRDPTQSGRYLVIALHQYRTRGTYTVRLTVTTSEANASVVNSTLTTTVTAR
jgi:streptogramin lyase